MEAHGDCRDEAAAAPGDGGDVHGGVDQQGVRAPRVLVRAYGHGAVEPLPYCCVGVRILTESVFLTIFCAPHANAARQVGIAPVQPPQYLADWRHNLEFSLEKMRLTEEPIGMQLLNRNARRPKKVRLRCFCWKDDVTATDAPGCCRAILVVVVKAEQSRKPVNNVGHIILSRQKWRQTPIFALSLSLTQTACKMAARGWERDDDAEITRRREEGFGNGPGALTGGSASQDLGQSVQDGDANADKVVKKKRNNLTDSTLVSGEGLEKIYKTFPFQVSGDVAGQEAKALGSLIKMYKQWAYDLYPGLNFEDFVDRTETLGKGHVVQRLMNELRTREMNRVLGINQNNDDDDEEMGEGVPHEFEEGDEAML
ncbi:Timeless-interacting protein isoform x3, partial [Globisporangium splendens]